MEFTKEQKEIIEEMYNLQLSGSVFGARIKKAFPEVLKPKRKKIFLEVESDYAYTDDDIRGTMINRYNCHDIKVTELPEVFTREDIKDLRNHIYNDEGSIDDIIDDWLSERTMNLNKK